MKPNRIYREVKKECPVCHETETEHRHLNIHHPDRLDYAIRFVPGMRKTFKRLPKERGSK